MPASLSRRIKRQEERYKNKLIKKIHQETLNKFKGMTDEQIMLELQKYNANNNIANQTSIPGVEISD